MQKTTVLLGLVVAAAVAMLASRRAAAQEQTQDWHPAKAQEQLLYSFLNSSNDGHNPKGGLSFDAVGNLYGTTYGGGSTTRGTVFELSPQSDGSWAETVLYIFHSNDPDGGNPIAGVISDAAGNLYGTTSGGRSTTRGTVFELSPQSGGGWTETVLHRFKGYPLDGGRPAAGLVFDTTGNLYGTTFFGGGGRCHINGDIGCGIVFELVRKSGGRCPEKVLYSFQGNSTDGRNPYSGLIFDMAGNLYGTTQRGG
jgi:uncharacterized repeat protein (TIGR03803 family)